MLPQGGITPQNCHLCIVHVCEQPWLLTHPPQIHVQLNVAGWLPMGEECLGLESQFIFHFQWDHPGPSNPIQGILESFSPFDDG